MDIESINSSDLISMCLFNEIIIFANKLIAINTYKNSFDINKLCEISKFKLSNELNKKNFIKGFKEFLVKAMPLTILTAILFLISLFFLNKYYFLDSAISKVIFIGLASLTFPHILLEYFLEKNEK